MNNTTIDTWKICFDQYNKLGDMTRTILRNSAVNRLVSHGFEEVGSSDVNHELFAMWNGSKGDWQQAVVTEVNRFAANMR